MTEYRFLYYKNFGIPNVNDKEVQHIAITSKLPYESGSLGKKDLAAVEIFFFALS